MRIARRTAVGALAAVLLVPFLGPAPASAAIPGTPQTWGSNSFGELGDGTNTNHFTAEPVVGLTDAIEIGGGREHVVALRAGGTVWTWGSSQYGQLGNGSTSHRSTPGQVTGLAGVLQVAGGHYHSMALLGDRTVRTWGMNSQGQLGDGTTSRRTRPVPVLNLTNVTMIAGARGHSLALRADGTVWAWGYNAFGELGDGTFTSRRTPVQTTGLNGAVVDIAGGRDHSVVLRSDGTVWAFGHNTYGQLGDGSTAHRNRPVRAGTLTGVVAVAAGAYHSLALRNDGTVWAWGRNNLGQLGNGTTTRRTTPVRVGGTLLTGVIDIACGRDHGMAVLANGTVRSWGANEFGQLGDGTTANRTSPVTVVGLSGVSMVTGGRSYTAAL